MTWRDFDAELWKRVREEADAGVVAVPLKIRGSDRASRAVDSAGQNLRFAGLSEDIRPEICSFEDSVPKGGTGFIISNPPYDERLPIGDSMAFYKMIGDTLKRKYTGHTAWLISSDLETIKFIGLRPSRKITVYNGPLECRFIRFDLFAGKKGHPQPAGEPKT